MRKIVLLTIVSFLIVACDRALNDEFSRRNQAEDLVLKSVVQSGDDVYVYPSGDVTGEEDADNIEYALNEVKASGGGVYLTDGDDTTIDHFYTNRNIVTTGFQGALVGESMDNTLIHAGRRSETVGFQAAVSPWWEQLSEHHRFATVFQIDNAIGDVTIKNLSILVKDDQPTDVQPDYYGNDATFVTTMIEILGGEHNTFIENVRLEGKETSAFGNSRGMNVETGIHVMLGEPLEEINEKGVLYVKNIELENIGYGSVLFMRFAADSKITVKDVRGNNVGRGIQAGGLFSSSIKIFDNEFSMHSAGMQGVYAWNISAGMKIMRNTFVGSNNYGMLLFNIDNSLIRNNTIRNHHGNWWYNCGITAINGSENNHIIANKIENQTGAGSGIRIDRGSAGNLVELNDFINSDLPGWTTDNPDGPGAVFLGSSSRDNYVHEMKFPPKQSKTLCEMILDLTDNPETLEYDGQNEIHNYVPCENLARRDLKFEGFDYKRVSKRFGILSPLDLN